MEAKSSRPANGGSDDPILISRPVTRIAVLAAAAIILGATAAWTFATVTAELRPQTSLAMFRQAGALEARAAQRVELAATPEDMQAARALAREAIRRSPVATGALRTLALLSDMSGKKEQSDRLLTQSNRLTRRDDAVRLLLIERAALQGNVEAALNNYDIALRTSPDSADTLFPILSAALRENYLIQPLARRFAADPPWLPQFLEYAIPKTPAPQNLARIMMASRNAEAVRRPAVSVQMAERLIADNRPELARDLVYSLARLRSEGFVRDPAFAGKSQYPPLDWSFPDQVGLGADRTRQGLSFFADPDTGGVVARQLVVLPAGSYRIEAKGAITSADQSGAKAAWTVRCLGSGSQLVRVDLGAAAGSKAAPSFVVPNGGCQGQWLELSVDRPLGRSGVEGRADSIKITKVAE